MTDSLLYSKVYSSNSRYNSKDYISGITLPSKQTAYKDSFDPNAALMIAKSSDKNNFNFLNVVSLVKVTTEFDCKRIVLNANEDIAGTGELYWDDTDPSISFTSNTSKSIVLKPQEGKDKIAAGTYYIAVNPGTLASGWSISFTSTDYNVYTRKANSGVTFNRGKIRSIGTFSTSGTWTHTSRGSKVRTNQEVDLGLTITKDGTNYRVIFAKYNLTKDCLAANEYDFGDYFAWAAKEPWCTSYSRTGTGGSVSVTPNAWSNTQNATAYDWSTVPYKDGTNESCSQYTKDGDVLAMSDDAAHEILGGDWQLPTKDIWENLNDENKYQWDWTTLDDYNGRKVTSRTDNTKTIFLPAAGYVRETSFRDVGSYGRYWSGTAYSSTRAYGLYFNSGGVYAQSNYYRYHGYSVRPVRLVAVD